MDQHLIDKAQKKLPSVDWANIKEFYSPEEVDAWAVSCYSEEYVKKYSYFNSNSPLNDYKGALYKNMNASLMQGVTKRTTVKGLQDMLLSDSLPNSIVTYRFVSLKELLHIFVGTIFDRIYTVPIFWSTTLLKEDYAMGDIKNGRFLITILAPEGSHGRYVPEVNPDRREYEVLFAHNIKLKKLSPLSYCIIA